MMKQREKAGKRNQRKYLTYTKMLNRSLSKNVIPYY